MLLSLCFTSSVFNRVDDILLQFRFIRVGRGVLLNQLDKQPEFEGGYEQFILYISEEVKKAPEGTFDGIEDKVFIDFIIDKEGSVSHVSLKNPLPSGAAKELKSILEKCPAWAPGQINGESVATIQTLPIKF